MSPDQLSTRQQQWGHTMKTASYIDVTNRVIAAMTSAGTDWTAPFRQTSDGVARSVDGHVESHAKYLNNWVARLKEDKRAIFTAAAAAQRAVAYLSNRERQDLAA